MNIKGTAMTVTQKPYNTYLRSTLYLHVPSADNICNIVEPD